MKRQLCLGILFSAVATGGCFQDPTFSSGPNGPNGKGDNPGGYNPTQGPNCGAQTFPIQANKAEPNVLMVLDKSGSMNDLIAGTNPVINKMTAVKTAVTNLFSTSADKANWGLSLYPQGNNCTPGDIEVPLGDAAPVQSVINGVTPAGNTPTAQTLEAVAKSGVLKDTTRNNYVLLLTDGLPNCGANGDDVTVAVTNLYAASPSVRTFVVGFGSGTKTNPGLLTDWALAGHTERSGNPAYYQAENVTDLQNAFAEIVAGIASCTYKLADKPSDPSLVVGYIDGQAVSGNDPANGFIYDAGSVSIEFKGSSCDKIKQGGAAKVDIIYGCPSAPIF